MTDFISFITCEACEKCKNEKRKTINGDDLVYALEVFGFDKYVKILKLYLTKYRIGTIQRRSLLLLFELTLQTLPVRYRYRWCRHLLPSASSSLCTTRLSLSPSSGTGRAPSVQQVVRSEPSSTVKIRIFMCSFSCG